MNAKRLREILQDLQGGRCDLESAFRRLRDLPYEDLGFARLDHHRALRTGFPEAVFCEGKTPDQVAEIIVRLAARHPRILGTRASREAADAVRRRLPDAVYHETARLIVAGPGESQPDPTAGTVLVCAAGTSDLPIADEAAITSETLGAPVSRLWDVGVAGLHRLLEHREAIAEASAIIAVAGMEGALPGIVAGLASCPVIAVPTSVGYGASFGGLAALLTMINSCAPGVVVVNIDNGFGAGVTAHRIARGRRAAAPRPGN